MSRSCELMALVLFRNFRQYLQFSFSLLRSSIAIEASACFLCLFTFNNIKSLFRRRRTIPGIISISHRTRKKNVLKKGNKKRLSCEHSHLVFISCHNWQVTPFSDLCSLHLHSASLLHLFFIAQSRCENLRARPYPGKWFLEWFLTFALHLGERRRWDFFWEFEWCFLCTWMDMLWGCICFDCVNDLKLLNLLGQQF